VETATLNGEKVATLTFTPKEGQALGFDQLVLIVDTGKWLLRQSKATSQGQEVITSWSYEDGLASRIVSTGGPVKTEIENTFVKKGKAKLLAKQTIEMEGPEVPESQQKIVITYSDVKINEAIPEEVFTEPLKTAGPKPKESAQELFQQATAAVQQGDMVTAKMKLRLILTHYPDDPLAGPAKVMLEQMP